LFARACARRQPAFRASQGCVGAVLTENTSALDGSPARGGAANGGAPRPRKTRGRRRREPRRAHHDDVDCALRPVPQHPGALARLHARVELGDVEVGARQQGRQPVAGGPVGVAWG
jgi:hypothetical protein